MAPNPQESESESDQSKADEQPTPETGTLAAAALGLEQLQPDQDIISTHHHDVKKEKVIFGDEEIYIYSAPPGKLINPTLEKDGQSRYAEASGTNLYTHFVEMREVLEKQNMIGEVEEAERWSEANKSPENILVDGFDGEEIADDLIAAAAVGIENIDRDHGLFGWLDPVLCIQYAEFEKTIRDIWQETVEKAAVGVALLRAGGASLELAGYDESNSALLQAKRHNMVGNPTNIGIGLNIDENTLNQIRNAESIELAERAIASGSSLLALIMVLDNASVLPDDIRVTGVGAAQPGLAFMDNFLSNFLDGTGKKHSIKVARIFYILTGGDHPYYIQALSGSFAVSDGGDYADLLLPPEQRTVWNKPFAEDTIEKLKKETAVTQLQLDDLEIVVGGDILLEQVVGLRNICVDNLGDESRFKVGEILTGTDYINTNAK